MSEETKLRERICLMAASLYARGLTHGSTGNISARLEDGRIVWRRAGEAPPGREALAAAARC